MFTPEHSLLWCSLQNILYSEDASPSDHPVGCRSPSDTLWGVQVTKQCGAGQPATPSNILHTPSNILQTHPNILCTLSNILRTQSNIICTLSNILHIPLIFYTPYLIFYLKLTCDAAAVDTWLAWPLPQGVVNCPCVALAFPCPVELGAFQVSAHRSAPETEWWNHSLKLQTLVNVCHPAFPVHTQSVTTQNQQHNK